MSSHPAPFQAERLLESIQRLPPARRWWVAFSGGADSSALLHALWLAREHLEAPIHVLHVDHGLHPESAAWAEHCRQFCARRGLPLLCRRIEVAADGGHGIEAEARRARYAVAEGLLEPGDTLLTGHHAGDQAETLLLNLVRGSGVQGLAGMPRVRALGRGTLARPLLDFDGAALRAFLERQGVAWIEDSSNRDTAYDRNFVRLQLLPAMARRWPGAMSKLAESAHLVREASDFIEWSAGRLAVEAEVAPGVIDLRRLEAISTTANRPAAIRLVLRQWLRSRQAPSMPRARLQEFLTQTANGPRRAARAEWSGWLLQAYDHRLWLQRARDVRCCPERMWDTNQPAELGPGLGTLRLEGAIDTGRPQFEVFARQGGEKIACLPGQHHKSVKHVLQEAGVPPWMRRSIPLLALDGEVVAVADWTVSVELGRRLNDQGLKLRWEPDDPVLEYVHRNRRHGDG